MKQFHLNMDIMGHCVSSLSACGYNRSSRWQSFQNVHMRTQRNDENICGHNGTVDKMERSSRSKVSIRTQRNDENSLRT